MLAIFGGSQTWLCVSLALLACETGGVGDPCVPEDEYQSTFGGFDMSEVNVESGSLQCRTRICLVNHFQGRVTCPYGQSEADLALAASDSGRCRLPGKSGESESDAVTVPVRPQRPARRADDSVYCSCRCDGPDENVKYCDCPSGFACVKLIDELGFGSKELAGSYCIREGERYRGELALECSRVAANCGNDGNNP